MKKIPLLLALIPALALAGCGKSAPKKDPAADAPQSVYISAADCTDAGLLTEEQCIKLIDDAVMAHDKNAVRYQSLRSCEKAEGRDRCERLSEDIYRARLQAFLFAMTTPPVSKPLYPSEGGKVGFKIAKKEPVDAYDDKIKVSQAAMTLAHENAKNTKGGKGGVNVKF
ncbi:MAG: DUF1190 domain-containing protein [Hyphomicrobium sp.]